MLNSHPHAHADAKAATATLTEEAEGGWIEVVKIVGQAAQGHQTLNKHLIQFNKKTKFCYRRNHALRFHANFAGHNLTAPQFHQIALGLHGPAFFGGTLLAQAFQFGEGITGRLCLTGEGQLENVMHHQVGIPADGRSKVTIMIRRQAEMPLIFGGVAGLLQAAQQLLIDQARFRALGGIDQQLLQRKLRLFAQHQTQATFGGELLQLLEFERIGRGVNTIEQGPMFIG